MAMMNNIFGRGFQSAMNTSNWAQMPTAQPSQGLPTPVGQPIPAMPAPQPSAITGAADYNNAPWARASGTPPGMAAPVPQMPNFGGGILGAILRQVMARK